MRAVLNLNPRWKVRKTARLVCVEAFPDLAALSDADLKALTEEKMVDERDVSRRRRELHGRIDVLRTEHTRRLKERHGAVEVDAGVLSDGLLAMRLKRVRPDLPRLDVVRADLLQPCRVEPGVGRFLLRHRHRGQPTAGEDLRHDDARPAP